MPFFFKPFLIKLFEKLATLHSGTPLLTQVRNGGLTFSVTCCPSWPPTRASSPPLGPPWTSSSWWTGVQMIWSSPHHSLSLAGQLVIISLYHNTVCQLLCFLSYPPFSVIMTLYSALPTLRWHSCRLQSHSLSKGENVVFFAFLLVNPKIFSFFLVSG